MPDAFNQDEFIGLLVHSYNNHLAAMMGFTELSLLETEQEEVRERLEMVLESGNQAVILGKQLLSMISRLQVRFVPIDLVALLEEISKAHQLDFDNQIKQGKVLVDSDAHWLWYCLETVCQFCSQLASQTQFSWQLSHQQQGFRLLLNFSQSPLTAEQREALFTPYYSSRQLSGGKDIGLAFVKGFVEQMQGKLTVTEQGLEFYLPVSARGQ